MITPTLLKGITNRTLFKNPPPMTTFYGMTIKGGPLRDPNHKFYVSFKEWPDASYPGCQINL